MGSDQQTILVIEDEPAIARMVGAMLDDGGYVTVIAHTAEQARAALETHHVSLITLDLGLGRSDGLALARSLRAAHETPIIIISGKASETDRIVGLEIGADDYITKPFNVREVLARVRAVLRRSMPRGAADRAPGGVLWSTDGFVCDAERRHVEDRTGRVIELTTREFAVLIVFLQRPQRVLSRETLIAAMDGLDSPVLDRAIDTLVGRLRKKLGDPALIKTVRGAGYMFTAKVTRSPRK